MGFRMQSNGNSSDLVTYEGEEEYICGRIIIVEVLVKR